MARPTRFPGLTVDRFHDILVTQTLSVGMEKLKPVLRNDPSVHRRSRKEGKGAVVYGRDIVVGLPVEREIPTDLINSCLEEHFNTIIDSVKVILERTPPELGADIFKHGVYLTGGASQTSHFAELLQKSTGLKVNQAQRPLESVVLGMGRILKEDNYKSVAYAIEGMGK